jgi:hypothetical protein
MHEGVKMQDEIKMQAEKRGEMKKKKFSFPNFADVMRMLSK